MEAKQQVTKINGIEVEGEAHLQPGANDWIGVFLVARNLLKEKIEKWTSVIIEYEGPFECKDGCSQGKGKAKITHVRPDNNKIIINVEGIGSPVMEDGRGEDPEFGYNENLPPS